MCRYTVTITDFDNCTVRDVARVEAISLTKAWQIATRAARRGVKLYGGQTSRANWGNRGGQFPRAYRSSTITFHSFGGQA